jgi:cell fate regulator YaaT (PSP1 superfamily)
MKVQHREFRNFTKRNKILNLGDGSKATFYYTANDRIDFRLLIKDFAKEFSTRIEMKQVSSEAARLGGIGSCGRELCCSTTDLEVKHFSSRYHH